MTTDVLHAEESYRRAGRSALCARQAMEGRQEKKRGIKTYGKD